MARKVEQNTLSQAFSLRRNGHSLSEISRLLKVSKASLSSWFKGVHFSPDELLLLKKKSEEKRRQGVMKSVMTNRMRLAISGQKDVRLANKNFESFKKHPLFLTGLSLYWAQGAQHGGGFHYANSDPEKIRLMVSWATNYLTIVKNDLTFRVFASPTLANPSTLTYWAGVLGVKETIFKPTILLKGTKNEELNSNNMSIHKGSMRISYNSAEVLRRIIVWQKQLVRYYQET